MVSAYYNDNDPSAALWLEQLIKDNLIAPGEVDTRSIEDVTPNDLKGYCQHHFFAGIGGWSLALRQAGWEDSTPVWTGSCPCQPFSTAGKGEGVNDDRHLWPAFHWLICQYKPDAIFGEQTSGKAGESWLDIVQTDLESESYTCGAATFPACSVGLPHIRQRIYWFAHSQLQRPQGQGICGQNSSNNQANQTRETDRLVNAVQRNALPFLCSSHDGIPQRMGGQCIKGFGNAIVIPQAATFIETCYCNPAQ